MGVVCVDYVLLYQTDNFILFLFRPPGRRRPRPTQPINRLDDMRPSVVNPYKSGRIRVEGWMRAWLRLGIGIQTDKK